MSTTTTPTDSSQPSSTVEVDTSLFQCPTYPTRAGYIDTTGDVTSNAVLPSLSTPLRQATFQLPTVAFAYERGWRNQFKRAGFPGPEAEAKLAMDYLLPALTPESSVPPSTLLDMSCATGILTRQFQTLLQTDHADKDVRLIGADISHAMLSDAVSRAARSDRKTAAATLKKTSQSSSSGENYDDGLQKDSPTNGAKKKIMFVRADVGRLPFQDGSLDAVHAGAALHCWPQLQDGLREIERALKPGGRFFATTFETTAYWPEGPGFDALASFIERVQNTLPITRAYRFFDPQELEYILRAAGFVEVSVESIRKCVIVRCQKKES